MAKAKISVVKVFGVSARSAAESEIGVVRTALERAGLTPTEAIGALRPVMDKVLGWEASAKMKASEKSEAIRAAYETVHREAQGKTEAEARALALAYGIDPDVSVDAAARDAGEKVYRAADRASQTQALILAGAARVGSR